MSVSANFGVRGNLDATVPMRHDDGINYSIGVWIGGDSLGLTGSLDDLQAVVDSLGWSLGKLRAELAEAEAANA